jgi:hypothetical protein
MVYENKDRIKIKLMSKVFSFLQTYTNGLVYGAKYAMMQNLTS